MYTSLGKHEVISCRAYRCMACDELWFADGRDTIIYAPQSGPFKYRLIVLNGIYPDQTKSCPFCDGGEGSDDESIGASVRIELDRRPEFEMRRKRQKPKNVIGDAVDEIMTIIKDNEKDDELEQGFFGGNQ